MRPLRALVAIVAARWPAARGSLHDAAREEQRRALARFLAAPAVQGGAVPRGAPGFAGTPGIGDAIEGQRRALAVDAADEETIAWRLADRHPPRLTLRAGAEALAILGDDALRARAAQDAAFWSGLPIPIPPAPVADAMLGPGEAALSLGVLPMPGFAREADGAWRAPLAKALRHAAPALVDPALALAMVTDEGRIPRRHGALALARTGAAGIARSIAAVIEDAFGMVDMAAIVDEAAGIAPENALFQ
jgi:hypothetical protein